MRVTKDVIERAGGITDQKTESIKKPSTERGGAKLLMTFQGTRGELD